MRARLVSMMVVMCVGLSLVNQGYGADTKCACAQFVLWPTPNGFAYWADNYSGTSCDDAVYEGNSIIYGGLLNVPQDCCAGDFCSQCVALAAQTENAEPVVIDSDKLSTLIKNLKDKYTINKTVNIDGIIKKNTDYEQVYALMFDLTEKDERKRKAFAFVKIKDINEYNGININNYPDLGSEPEKLNDNKTLKITNVKYMIIGAKESIMSKKFQRFSVRDKDGNLCEGAYLLR